jgi:hypothetical protein
MVSWTVCRLYMHLGGGWPSYPERLHRPWLHEHARHEGRFRSRIGDLAFEILTELGQRLLLSSQAREVNNGHRALTCRCWGSDPPWCCQPSQGVEWRICSRCPRAERLYTGPKLRCGTPRPGPGERVVSGMPAPLAQHLVICRFSAQQADVGGFRRMPRPKPADETNVVARI